MGRVTYEEMASAWPTSTDKYAAPMNDIPKVVFSKTPSEATLNLYSPHGRGAQDG
jgi:dihydrofolate reductase